MNVKNKFNRFLRILGPGVVTGAADDDPSGIATYTQTGAQFGVGQLWTAVFMLPFMIAVQECCARIGMVTGKGIAAVVQTHYSKKVLYGVVFLVVVANTINIGADIGAMAAAAELVFPVNFALLTLIFTFTVLVLEIFTSYKLYSQILKWLAITLLAYPLTVLLISPHWGELLRASIVPHFEFNFAFIFIITGVLGTTISPYMFFWQASEEVEEERANHELSPSGKPEIGWKQIKQLRIDNAVGMFASNIATWSIIVVGALVLNQNGITDVRNAADAAKAIEPLVQTFPNSGFVAKSIFASGVIGLGLLAVPVLAGSAAYALSEAFGWKEGLYRKLKKAHGFYGVITLATVLGLAINFIGIDPVKALIFTAVFNGIVAVPLLFLIILIGRNKNIMGEYKNGWLSNLFLWTTFMAMGTAAIAMLYTLTLGSS